jgi:hypothetical protein
MRVHTVTVEGTAEKRVICDHCGKIYSYVATRTGLGTASSLGLFSLFDPRFWKYGGYGGLARLRAEEMLAVELQDAIDPVKCPACDKLQANMGASLNGALSRVRDAASSGWEKCVIATLPAGVTLGLSGIWLGVMSNFGGISQYLLGIGSLLTLAGVEALRRTLRARRSVTKDCLHIDTGEECG